VSIPGGAVTIGGGAIGSPTARDYAAGGRACGPAHAEVRELGWIGRVRGERMASKIGRTSSSDESGGAD